MMRAVVFEEFESAPPGQLVLVQGNVGWVGHVAVQL
jgi:NADPH:quinone reductase-like Zn-dependent oxidoreductase